MKQSDIRTPRAQERTHTEVLCLYHPDDERFYGKMKKCLRPLERQKLMRWLDVLPGKEQTVTWQDNISRAHLILFFLSPDFFADDLCAQRMKAALHEHAARDVPVVPILVRSVNWQDSDCKDFLILPRNQLPLQEWHSQDTAYTSILTDLRQLMPAWSLSPFESHDPPSPEAFPHVRRAYLTTVIDQREKLEIEGIPAPLLYEPVALDTIFILPRFKPHQALVDQEIPTSLRARLRAEIAVGKVASEVEAILIERARMYEQQPDREECIALQDLWKRLRREEPVAVIQGTPGMGKSTLLLRLALHMARKALGKKDALGTQLLRPTLVPLFLSLGPYATFRQQGGAHDEQGKSIRAYLRTRPQEMRELHAAQTVAWLEQELTQGHCLVLFDALDEVSDPEERRHVQDAIKAFITEQRSLTGDRASYNRFLITSRIAGYDLHAFAYHHYTLAELSQEQISDFLPRWCHASARRKMRRASPNDERILQQAATIELDLRQALQHHQGIQDMAENPFLLTLLVLLRQNGYTLPHRRIDLYQHVNEILLVHRNDVRHLPGIPENQAIGRLGHLATTMQATKNSFVTRREALSVITDVLIHAEKLSAASAPATAEEFLERVRLRGGIFVFRAGDFLGFFHRTFQEYFAARHLLNRLATDPTRVRRELLKMARRQDDLWREPFLLALAYKNSEPSREAHDLLHLLLAGRPKDTRTQRAHDTLLAGQCLSEATHAAIPHDLEQQIVRALLDVYARAIEESDTATCHAVEKIIVSLFQGISEEAEHSATLLTFQEALSESGVTPTHIISMQRVVLILLAMTGSRVQHGTSLIFRHLVPTLLGLAGLPTIGQFAPEAPTTPPPCDISDWALSALQALGTRGPAGEALRAEETRFEPYLEFLARISLERGLLTPVVVPASPEKSSLFQQAIKHWGTLQHKKPQQPSTQTLTEAIAIQQELLQAAETLWYPAHRPLLTLLECSHDQTTWQQDWQAHLREQMERGTYQEYQTGVMLWLGLFPEPAACQILAAHLKADLFGMSSRQRFARHFARKIVNFLSHESDLSDFSNLRDLRDLSDFSNLSDFRDLRDFGYLSNLRDLRDFSNLSDFRYFSDFSDFGYLINFSDFSYLSSQTFTSSLTKEITRYGLHVSDDEERVELLWLLFGRVVQIQKEEEKEREEELEILVDMTLAWSQRNAQTTEISHLILGSLPARGAGEITLLVRRAHETQDVPLRKAYARAVRRANPRDDQAWATLEAAQTSGVVEIEEAVRKRLQQRKAEDVPE